MSCLEWNRYTMGEPTAVVGLYDCARSYTFGFVGHGIVHRGTLSFILNLPVLGGG